LLYYFSLKTPFFEVFISPKAAIYRDSKKKREKSSIQNQYLKEIFHFFFKKHLEIKKKYLPLHSQTETMGLPIGDEREEKKFFENIGNSAK
jgi:hypothetical protein